MIDFLPYAVVVAFCAIAAGLLFKNLHSESRYARQKELLRQGISARRLANKSKLRTIMYNPFGRFLWNSLMMVIFFCALKDYLTTYWWLAQMISSAIIVTVLFSNDVYSYTEAHRKWQSHQTE